MTETRIIQADARSIPLPDQSIQTCVTSPPYYGLRDYGNADQIGLEPTLQEYIENLCLVFDEVWRVLRDDGTLWLNLGDSYNGSNKGGVFSDKSAKQATNTGANIGRPMKENTMKPKDLMGVPWRVALALQDRGWYLRSDIIWHKPNPMPESVKDRPTKSHEYIFLLTKKPKYYYDADAIREPNAESSKRRAMRGTSSDHKFAQDGYLPNNNKNTLIRPQEYRGYENMEEEIKKGNTRLNPKGRNKRTVWNITTRGYKGAHFAVFPPVLPETCIKAGSKEGDWVLDPFGGSGTTAMVAKQLGRNSVSLDINPEYLDLQRERTGLKALENWTNGKKVTANTEGLPMFGGAK